jgi:hypothetical protein
VRLFTPEEANAALALVRPRVERLARLRVALRSVAGELADARANAAGNGHGEAARRAAALEEARAETVRALADVAAELDEIGVQVKDPDGGLVDFPARHPDGSLVLLCWRVGEDEVSAWHTLDGGFAGRKPLPF